MSRVSVVLLIGALVFLSGSLHAAWFGKKKSSDVIRPVLTKVVQRDADEKGVVFSGVTKANLTINASFRVKGLVESLPIKVGDRLQQGQKIASLDPVDYAYAFRKAEADVDRAFAQKLNAANQYERYKNLYEEDSASKAELDLARAEFESAIAEVDAMQAALGIAEQQLSYASVIFDVHEFGIERGTQCFVAEKQIEVNENVVAGQIIAVLECFDKMEIEVGMPETSIGEIHVGTKAEVTFPIHDTRIFHAVVTEVGVASEARTVFPVTLKLTSDTGNILPGMSANVRFFGGRAVTQGVVVPYHAIHADQSGKYVYVFEGTNESLGVVHKKPIEILKMLKTGCEVKGVNEGDTIVVAGVRYLHDGKTVRLAQEIVAQPLEID